MTARLSPAARYAWFFAAFLLVRVFLLAITTASEYGLYYEYATAARQTSMAELHRGRDIEYPPLATLFGVAVAHLADALPEGADRLTHFRPNPTRGVPYARYEVALGIVLFAVDLACLALVYVIARRVYPDEDAKTRVGRLVLYFAATSAVGLILYDRQDLVVALVAVVALAAFMQGWRVVAYAVLAAGVAYKLVPLLLVPLWVLALAATHPGPRSTGRYLRAVVLESLLAGAFLLAVPALMYLFCGGERAFAFLTFHSTRGLQVEAQLAWPVFLIDPQAGIGHGFGSYFVRSALADRIARATTYATAAAAVLSLLVAACGFWRAAVAPQPPDRNALVTHLAASSLLMWLGFILFSKVGSPQYLLWLAPLVALLPRHGASRKLTTLLLAAMVFSTLIYPCVYDQVYGVFVRDEPLTWSGPTPLALALLAGKSLTVAAAFAWLTALVWRGWPASRESPSPSPEVV